MPPEPTGPFKFLDPYTRADRDIFFGRERETEALYAQLLARGLLLVYGVSGSGKTSLVQCGLANRFEPADCLAITVRRGADLPAALDAELARHAVTPARPGATIAQRVRSLYLDHFKPIHLIFDQLEELFIFGDRDERRAFAETLGALAGLPQEVRLIFVVREEYLGAMTEFEPVLPDLFRARIRIEPMDRAQARDAIDGPCARCGVPLEAGLTDAVLERLAPGEATIELTWLQVVMDRLYREALIHAQARDPARPTLTRAGLDALGPLDNVLGRFLEGQLQALEQPLAGEAVLKALVSGDGTRRPLSQEAIGAAATVQAQGLTGDALALLIQRLIAARILTDRDDHGLYELRHDSLARKVWERMSAREKELQEVRQMIDGRYRDHQRRGLLLDAETLNWIAPFADGLYLPPEQAAFVQASRVAVARKRRRWLTLAFGTLLLVLGVVAGLGGYGYLKAVEAKEQAREARHNLGFVFLAKAERALTDHRFNEARLYTLHALAGLDPRRPGPEIARGLVMSNTAFPLAFSSDGGKQNGGPVTTVSFSPDGRILASGSWGNPILLWDTATGQQTVALKGHTNGVNGVSFSPDGRTLASGSEDKTIRLWDVATSRQTAVLRGHTEEVTSICFSPDRRTLASGSWDKTIRLWDVATDQQTAVLTGHEDTVSSVSFSPDGRTLASGSWDKSIRLWDVASGQQITLLNGHEDEVNSVSFSPDGRTLVSGSRDKTIRFWDVATGQEEASVTGHFEAIKSVCFSPNGRTLASASLDNTLRLWDVATGQQIVVLTGYDSGVNSVSFSPDGRTLASGSGDKTVRLWEAAMGQPELMLTAHSDRVNSVQFSREGRNLASASNDKSIRLWDVASGQQVGVFRGHEAEVNSVSFAPYGRTLASASYDETVRLWNEETSQQIAALVGHEYVVTSVNFSPDGLTLASGSLDNTVRLWGQAAAQPTAVLTGHEDTVSSVSFSPDRRTLASGSFDNTIRLWDVTTLQQTAVLRGHEHWVTSVSFSPDGRSLASGSADRTIRLWDAARRQQTAVLTGHLDSVSSVTFSPDGRMLTSGSSDKTIRLWNAATGQETAVLTGHTEAVNSVSFSPDGHTLVSGSDDKTIRLWNLSHLYDPRPIAEQIKAAERQFGLHLVDLQLQPLPREPNPDGTPPRAVWSEAHPFHWLPAAERGDPVAMRHLGIIYERGSDWPQAETWYRQAADAGDGEAKARLADLERRHPATPPPATPAPTP